MRKILYISGTRADYGLIRSALISMSRHPKLNVEVVVTGMHLMNEFGKTINEIKKDNIKTRIARVVYKNDDRQAAVNFIGGFILKFTKLVKQVKPDMILVLGDRAEALAGAIVGAYLRVPVVHIHGGDVSSTVDEIARHAITKLSHIHLAATGKSAQRIIKMGEDPWRVYVVGAPGLEGILHEKLIPSKDIAKKYRLDLCEPFLLAVQHPASIDDKEASRHMRETMEAIKELRFQAIVVYPNADSGARAMIKVIERYKKYSFIRVYKNIFRKEYLSLMKIASVMIGNSSSGIIEAPSFHLPVVNIGARQDARESSENIIDAGYNREDIKAAIKKAIYDAGFKEKVRKCKNPYGDGKTSSRIIKILNKVNLDERVLQKKITF